MLSIKQAPTTFKKLGNTIRKFEGTESTFEIPYVKKKWLHGLRSNKEIQKVESHYGRSFSNPEDNEFWGSLKFSLNHFIEPLSGLDNPEDLLKVRVLEASKILTSSYQDFISNENGDRDFILYDENEETSVTASLYEKRDLAVAELVNIKKTPKYLIAVAKSLLPVNMSIPSKDAAYVKLREYIDGKVIKNKTEAVDKFLACLEKDKSILYVEVDFDEAFRKNVIRKNSNKRFYNPMTGVEYGKTKDEAVSFLMNPKNQDELGTGLKGDEPYSIRAQLNGM